MHSDTIKDIYIESKQSAILKQDVVAFHGVYCDYNTHYVRVTTSQPFRSTSTTHQIDEDVLTFREFLKKDFRSSETYTDTLKTIEEFDKQCCRTIHDTAMLSARVLINWLRLCFSACIPTLRKSRSRHYSSISNLKSTPRYPSIGPITTDDEHDIVVDNSISITNSVLPEDIIAIIAIQSFYSTFEGVCGYGVLVATRSDTLNLQQRIDLRALLPHGRIMNQLRGIVGEHVYRELLEFEEKHMNFLEPVYQGILPDDLLIGVGEELLLENCSPMLQAQVDNCLAI
ncbi:hypothetical protein GGP41_003159 [Bipolaris sorokiniana]|uniref:Uncharacterized protein n=1 Tax=Cochliobolus sativus TaxID=45130 RepID=A0A8H5Z732_COCSA|nr:hypothetical protein GGP41_003159 [Bipolaris sorokiniana]